MIQNINSNVTIVRKQNQIQEKTAGVVLLQTGSEITEKEQLLCNTHNDIICHDIIMPFHQPGTGDSRKFKRSIFTQRLVLNTFI